MKKKDLEKAQEALKSFLDKHPKMKDYQDELTRRLSKAPTFENRMEILKLMMAERLSALGKELEKLRDIAENKRAALLKEAAKNG